MLELKGKYASAKIFTDVVDNESISQVVNLLNQPYAEGSKIRMMPDIHAGAGCTIGTTMTIADKVCPNLVGVDIGCGMLTAKLSNRDIDFERLDKTIRDRVPCGFGIHSNSKYGRAIIDLSKLLCIDYVDIDRAYRSVGTLGGGNHFIEVDCDEDGYLYLVIHSGSRHLGLEIAKYYQNQAIKSSGVYKNEEICKEILRLKSLGRETEIEESIKRIKNIPPMPKDAAYISGKLFDNYIHDMKIAQKFASLNRERIIDTIVFGMSLDVSYMFETVHNYIDTENMILRKGAVSAKEGERLLIPINMRDGSLLCTGKGNSDWNFSAPHGAGRLMSRSAAKEVYTVEEFEATMKDIYTTTVSYETLDECPMAYKKMSDIVDNIGPTVTINKVIKPIYNFKA